MWNLRKLKTGNLDENDWPRIIDAMAVLSEAKIYIDDTPGIKISEIRSKCRKIKNRKRIRFNINRLPSTYGR